MSPPDQVRAKMLIQIARDRYASNLTDAELKILCNSVSSFDMDESEPESPWPAVSPEFLRWLATDIEAASEIDPKGIRILGVKVSGDLDFEGCTIGVPLTFCWCVIQGEIELASAKTLGIFLLKSELSGGFSAGRARIRGPLFLDGSNISGVVCLVGAQIGGQLSCFGAKLCSKGDRTWAERGIDLLDNDSNLIGQAGNRDALSADGAEIAGDVFLSNEFLSTGTIRLTGALIHGDLNCTSASLLGRKRGHALTANRAEVRGTVFLNGHFKSVSTVSLIGAQIKGDLDCGNAKLVAKEGVALAVDRAEIAGTVLLNHGFESSGAVRFSGARIMGELNLCGARLLATEGDALAVKFAKIEGGILFGKGFECAGSISLLNAQVGGQVAFTGATIARVDCTNLDLSGDFHWTKIDPTDMTELNLAGARVRNLHDDRESWPWPDHLVLSGLNYEELTLLHRLPQEDSENNILAEKQLLRADDRIEWLMLQPHDRLIESQPWMHLRKHLEEKGDRSGARRVLYKLRCLRAREKWLIPRRWAIAFAWLEDAPWRILYSLAACLLLGTLIFAGADRSGAIIPSAMVLTSANAQAPPNRYPPFQPFIYTLENAVPLIKLGMDDKWIIDMNHTAQPWFPGNYSFDWLRVFNDYWFLAISRWALILSGWFQASVLAAALLGRFKE